MDNFVENEWKKSLLDKSIEFKDYCKSNKNLIFWIIPFALLSHGVSLFYYKIGIDSEQAIYNYDKSFNPDLWIGQGRFGIAVLKRIFGTGIVTVPIFNITISCIALVISIYLILYLLNRNNIFNDDKIANVIFSIMFITSTQLVMYLTFTMYSFGVSVGFLITTVSIIFATRYSLDKHFIQDLIVSCVLMILGISIYQSFINFFILGVCLVLIINKTNCKSISLKCQINQIINYIMILAISVSSYSLINYILIGIFGSSGYIESFIGWGKQDNFLILSNILNNSLSIICGHKLYGSYSIFISYIIILYMAVYYTFLKSKNILFYVFGYSISIFLLDFLLGGVTPLRALVALPLFVSGSFYLLFKSINKKEIRITVFILIFLLAVNQAAYCTKLHISDFIRYNQDVNTAVQINETINTKYNIETKYPIIFVGSLKNDNKFVIKLETVGSSIFEHDDGNIFRIIPFMEILGYNYEHPSEDDIVKGYKISQTMKSWPSKDSVYSDGSVIVVKLSEPSQIWTDRYINN